MPDFDLKLFDHVSAPVFVLDIGDDGLPRYCAYNRFACTAAGLRPEQVIGKTAAEVYGNRMGAIALDHHKAAARSGKTHSYLLELPLRGQTRCIHTTLSPQIDSATGRVVRLVGTSVDLTDECALEQMLTEAQTRASEIEQYIALAAHDLRAPMRNIRQLLEMLSDDFTDLQDGKIDLIRMMDEVAESAAHLIGDVLSHANTTQAPPDDADFALDDLCNSLVTALDPQMVHEFRWPDVHLSCDKTALQIALRNLIDNAMKYGNVEHMLLTIAVNADAAGLLCFTVQDNGAGMQSPGHAFLDTGKLRSHSGFGLAAVRRLLRARGGDIEVAATGSDVGCTITFRLPGRILASPAMDTTLDRCAS